MPRPLFSYTRMCTCARGKFKTAAPPPGIAATSTNGARCTRVSFLRAERTRMEEDSGVASFSSSSGSVDISLDLSTSTPNDSSSASNLNESLEMQVVAASAASEETSNLIVPKVEVFSPDQASCDLQR